MRADPCVLDCACFVPESGENIHLTIVEEKATGLEMVVFFVNGDAVHVIRRPAPGEPWLPGVRRNDNAKTMIKDECLCSDWNIWYSLSGAFSIRCLLALCGGRLACHFTTIHLPICRLKPVFAERSSGKFSTLN